MTAPQIITHPNPAAMAALQTLRAINHNLETTQGRISSGYRVETAADNAAYWSIATTMRSDNAALSTVHDALGLGAGYGHRRDDRDQSQARRGKRAGRRQG